MEVRFIADSMLGRLAKWLRVMGYDTHYRPVCQDDMIDHLVRGGCLLLSRHRPTIDQYRHSLLILSNHVKEQLHEIRAEGYLTADRSRWFLRCLTCNLPLREVAVEDVREDIPEYVFYQNITELRFCPSCGRYFWPGSHKNRMLKKLEEWGFQ